ncbi:maltoporin [Chitinimonas taiwanensis DSM 18899]|uniref:Maltoporin n=2 Tax=Chitinimonas TaxID=240411 RepID=A0A1K2HNS3_9NEIS|nr:maltoporin [Chitinimonas taiwanensis DSM 18899]
MTRKSKVFAAVMAAFMAQGAFAETTFNGYLRSGSGSNGEGGKEACFQLNNTFGFGGRVASAGRLGAECDTYGEFALGADMGESNGTKFKINTLLAFGAQQNQDYEQSVPAFREAYAVAEGVGTGMLASANIWAGKRYYKRADVHIVDLFTLEVTGPGAGIENVDLGFGKFSYALMRAGQGDYAQLELASGGGDDQELGRVTRIGNAGKQMSNHDLRLEGVNLGAIGSLSVGANIISNNSADGVDKTKGHSLWATHSINLMKGVQNSVTIQTAKDSGSLNGAGLWWSGANVKGHKAWRVIDSVNFDFGDINGAVFAGIANEKFPWNEGKTWSFVARPVYHFSENYSVALEAGTTRTKPKGGDSTHINKLTIAPQLSLGKSFWARPALRAYYTYASWSDKGDASAKTGRDNLVTVPGYADKKSGSSYGVQMEAWW